MKHFIPSRQDGNGAVLDVREAHYLLRVRRLSFGDSLVCLDGQGRTWTGTLSEGTGGEVRILRQDEVCPAATPAGPGVHLVQALPKGRKLDDIVRQACELGAAGIHCWRSAHAIPRLEDKWESRAARLQAIVREAAQQSGNSRPPILHAPESTGAILDRMAGIGATGLVFYERDIAEGSLHGYLSASVGDVYAFIGPEGGLSPDELDMLRSGGCQVVSLGPTILRTETAGIAALAAVQAILRERAAWIPA